MNIYRQTITQLERHNERYHIDLKSRTLRVGRKVIIADGQPVEQKDKWGIDFTAAPVPEFSSEDTAPILAEIEQLYAAYKHSVPGYTERAHYFKALKYEELTQADQIGGQRRITAQFQLEYFLLYAISTHLLPWWMGDKFYWRSEQDRDLVILRDWGFEVAVAAA